MQINFWGFNHIVKLFLDKNKKINKTRGKQPNRQLMHFSIILLNPAVCASALAFPGKRLTYHSITCFLCVQQGRADVSAEETE